jgi:electron transfer flavoprotein beta subunit
MKIVVCLKEVIDSGLNLVFDPGTGELFRKGLAYRLNPDDVTALAQALGLKDQPGAPVEIVLISIGPESVEQYLRDGLSGGADSAVRIWGEDLEDLSSYQKARILSGAVSLLDADLILTGARSLDMATCQVGPLLAAWLDFSCVTEAVSFRLDREQDSLTAVRNIGRGARESVQCSLPAVLTITGEGRELPYAPLDIFLESRRTPITRLSPADLGLTPAEWQDDPSRVTGLSFPRPRPRKVPAPESTLPAFDRILRLLQGGLTRRRGQILRGSDEELVNQLYDLLVADGVVKPDDK